jgi:hypothetical protein
MSPKSVNITVDPVTRPRVLTIVAFPGEEVIFRSRNGDSTFFFPEGNQIFKESNSVVLDVSDGGEIPLHINEAIFENFGDNKSVDRRGALFVEYAVSCKNGDGIYFAEGDSPPRIIIPPR